ncbi:helix-turn-helix domain-containing protein [Paenibacillus sp. AR247]|uniref:helix-turn-helix domain-containing protein n=1 Tax=Paenibacillus sp. AR247 TaxID=1631599 RepID=UPI0035BE8B0F
MVYSNRIQHSIRFMEEQLHEPLTLEQIAAEAGFSPFHFHRLFRRETGLSIAEYLRSRRLCLASRMLLYSEEPIIGISLQCHFESQEAFTRAFKKMYGMPPGRYRKMFSLHTQTHAAQGGEMNMIEESLVKGWMLSGSHPHQYEIGLDRHNVHQGNASGYLKAVTPEGPNVFATMMQQFKADRYLKRRMRFSGFVRTEGVTEFCGLWMRVDNQAEDVLRFDNMNNRRIVGDTHWNHYAIVLDVPDNAATISLGVLLMGPGQVWVDSFRFEEVDESVPTTNLEIVYELRDEPSNLTFEE